MKKILYFIKKRVELFFEISKENVDFGFGLNIIK